VPGSAGGEAVSALVVAAAAAGAAGRGGGSGAVPMTRISGSAIAFVSEAAEFCCAKAVHGPIAAMTNAIRTADATTLLTLTAPRMGDASPRIF